jgi:NTP pyrophosphatase (non-canonical NTP hydrolase)
MNQVIINHTPRAELLAQLAEECSELAKAALKLRRAITQTSPTNVPTSTAETNFREECADVLLTMKYATGGDTAVMATDDITEMADYKECRWVQRIQGDNE